MKSELVLMGVVVVFLLSSVACGSDAEPVQLLVGCDDFADNQHISRETEVAVDGQLQVFLCSNPSTGYQWSESAEIGDASVLQQTEHENVAPEGENEEPPAPGTPGQEKWAFDALEKGSSTIYMEYIRPWESGENATWTFSLNVDVK